MISRWDTAASRASGRSITAAWTMTGRGAIKQSNRLETIRRWVCTRILQHNYRQTAVKQSSRGTELTSAAWVVRRQDRPDRIGACFERLATFPVWAADHGVEQRRLRETVMFRVNQLGNQRRPAEVGDRSQMVGFA